MKHESIVVVYDSCQAIAEEIADKLGAETVSVQSINVRQIENSQSLVLAIEFQDGGNLSPHWQYASQLFRGACLSGKNLAVMVALGNRHDNSIYAEAFCSELRKNGAHIVGNYLYADAPTHNLNHPTAGRSDTLENWICAISPNL
jgi:flavodoxin